MKYILVIGDGMADNPVESLGGITPLQHAHKPYMDFLARKGETCSVKTVPSGVVPGSDTAILSIFGYDPLKYYTGRAPLEAAGCGVSLEPGNIALRCNMVALEPGENFSERKIFSHSAGSIDAEAAVSIMEKLISNPEFSRSASKVGMKIAVNGSFRHIAVLNSGDTSEFVTTPPHDILGSVIGSFLPRGGETGEVLKEIMQVSSLMGGFPENADRLAKGKLPASAIWFWAEGTVAKLPSFMDMFGKTSAVISAVPLVWGIGSLAGADVIKVEGATGELDTNYEGKAASAVTALKDGYDFVAVHVEAPDECTHNGDLEGKLKAIEFLSERVIKNIDEGMKEAGLEYRMLVLSDHKTLTSTRGHDGDPVPYMIYDSSSFSGQGRPYDELSCGEGRFLEAGTSLMSELFKK